MKPDEVSSGWTLAASALMGAAIFGFDLVLPLGVAGGVPYVAVVLLSLWLPGRGPTLTAASASSVLTVAGYALSPIGGVLWVVVANRALALLAIWVTAGLGLGLKAAYRGLREAHDEMEVRVRQRTMELSLTNERLEREVQERLEVEDRQRGLLAETQAILDAAMDAIVIIGIDGAIVSFNPAAEGMFGYSIDEIVGCDVERLIPSVHHERRLLGHADGTGEVTGLKKDGTSLPLHLSVNEVLGTDGRLLAACLRDLTQQRAMERQVRTAASEAAIAEQRERRKLARDLHDGLGQLLSLIGMRLAELRGTPPFGARGSPLQEVVDLVSSAAQLTTSLSFQLSPPLLDDVGLVAAAQWLAEQMEQSYNLSVSVQDDGQTKPLTGASRVTLFQALRELLINVAKHANVHEAHVQFCLKDTQFAMSVADAGAGFDPASPSQGYGLLSLKERVQHLGGSIEIDAAPGEGARVLVVVPLKHEKCSREAELI